MSATGGASSAGGAGDAGELSGGAAGSSSALRGGAGAGVETGPGGSGGATATGHDGGAGAAGGVTSAGAGSRNEPQAGASGEAGTGAVGDSPLPPGAFDQLTLWLEASPDNCPVDGTQRVTGWLDASTNDNDAQPRPSFQRPEYVATAVNGHPALRFTPLITANGYEPTVLDVADSASLQFSTRDFAYILVMSWSNDPRAQGPYSGSGSILSKQGPLSPYPGLLITANHPAYFPDAPGFTRLAVQCAIGEAFALSATDHLNDNHFRLYVVRRTGTEISIRINGVHDNATKIASDVDLSAPGRPLVIGGSLGFPLKGDIAEIVALRGATSDADLARLEAFLMDKYALR